MARHSFSGPLAFLTHPASGGVVLFVAAVLAMIASNSSLAPAYDALLGTPVSVRIATFAIEKPLLLWINDGLMAIFFFLVGLEIKRELVVGALSSLREAVFPLVAAVGGMAAPALVYVALNATSPATLGGWAIPAATDIAFAIGVLALVGPRVPYGLKIFLLALAIIDDLGGIVIIALFYTTKLSGFSLLLAGAGAAALFAMNRLGVRRTAPYVIVGVLTWACVLKSGVHATLAGVLVAAAIPIDGPTGPDDGLLERLKHDLEPWVHFLILPLFAFANAGVSLAAFGWSNLTSPVTLGIALGLLIGKQAGIFGFAWAAVRLGWASLPDGVTWRQIYGVGLIAGIGFTMSLFIGTLAFSDPARAAEVRLGVLIGSLLAGVAGYLVLRTEAAGADEPLPAKPD